MRRERGFTLLETMLALFISALVLSLVYSSVRVTGGSMQAASVRNDLYRSTFALLEEMSKELGSAYLSGNGNPLNGRAKTYFYVENRDENEMQEGKLFFTTYGHGLSPMAVGESDQSEVCYSAQYNRERDELVLLKKEDLTLDDNDCRDEDFIDWDRPYAELPVPVATSIHPERGTGYRLVGFQVECRRTTDEDEEPSDTWDSEELRALPSRVWITLTYKDDKDNLIPFTKMVQLRLQMLGTTGPEATPAVPGGDIPPEDEPEDLEKDMPPQHPKPTQ